MPEGRDMYRDGNVRADRAVPYFVAGTHGQFPHPAAAYASGIPSQQPAERPPTDEEAKEMMEWDAKPENQRHRMGDLMTFGAILQEVRDRPGPPVGVNIPTAVSRWVNTDREAQRGWSKPNFPNPVTPQEWSLRGNTQNQLWRRSDVENWMDANTRLGTKLPTDGAKIKMSDLNSGADLAALIQDSKKFKDD